MGLETQEFHDFEESSFEGAKKLKRQQNQDAGEEEGLPADGRKVGNPEKGKEASSLDKPDVVPIVPAVEVLEGEALERRKSLQTAAQENPDWPPAQGNPEAESRLSADLESGMNTIS